MAAIDEPLVVLTRPEGRNVSLARRLRGAGFQVLELPALVVRPLPFDPTDLPLPQECDLIVFVSAYAASLYLSRLAEVGWAGPWPDSTLAATVGEASARPLREAGFIPDDRIIHPAADASQDSEALWALLRRRGASLRRVVLVRGESGREWLGARLQEQGAHVRRYAVYQRQPAQWGDDQRQALLAGMGSAREPIVLLTSSESVDAFLRNLRETAPSGGMERLKYVVIHERIATRLQSGLGALRDDMLERRVRICKPDDDDILRAVASFASL